MVAVEVGLIVAGTAAASLAVANSARSVTPYAYLMAKVRAWEARMLGDGKIESLVDSDSVDALVAGLRGSDYEADLEGISLRADDLEKALARHMAGIYRELFGLLPEKALAFMRKFAERMELGNLRLVVQAVAGRVDLQLAISHLADGLVFSRERLEIMARSEGMEALIEHLSETEYFQELGRYLEPGEFDPAEIIRAIDHSYYLSVWRRSTDLGRKNGKIARQLVGREVDLANIKLILRLKASGAGPDVVMKNLVPLEGEMKIDLLRMCAQAESMEAVGNILSASPLKAMLAPIVSSPSAEVPDIEKLLDESLLDYAKSLSLFKPLTIATPLAFIHAKEAEVRDIRTLARGIEDGIPPSDIRRLTVRSGRIE
jgi:V/A-type H+-transporting ATPase subunit C